MAVKEKIRIRIKGYDHQLVDQSAEKIVATAKRTGARVSGPVPLPTEKQIITILRAVHKYKDSREQFEMRTHKRLIDILRPSNKTVEALMGLELPAGVEIEIKLSSGLKAVFQLDFDGSKCSRTHVRVFGRAEKPHFSRGELAGRVRDSL